MSSGRVGVVDGTQPSLHRVADEPTTLEIDGLRWVVSGTYLALGLPGSPVFDVFDTDERLLYEWAPDVRMCPSWVELEVDGGEEPDFRCRIELRDDAPRMVELGWRARENQKEIRQKHLREVEVAELVNMVYGPWVVELRGVWRDKPGMALPTKIDSEQMRVIRRLLYDLRTGRRHIDSELLRQVADVYRANFASAPAQAVARAFGVKQRMAHEYVRRARERGFLPPTTQGKKKA